MDPYEHAKALYDEAAREVANMTATNDSTGLNKWVSLAEALLTLWPQLAKD